MSPVVLALTLTSIAFALDVPPLTGRIVDRSHLLSTEQAAALTATLADHERRTGNQIAVLTTPSLEGEPLEEYAHRVASTWQLGRKGTDNGVLLLISPGDRRVRIEVGYGLEGALTDAKASRIIRNEITPRFKEGDFPGGIEAGVKAILGTIEGTYIEPAPSKTDSSWDVLIIAVLVGVFVGAIFNRAWRPLGSVVSGLLSFILALPAGWLLAGLAGIVGLVIAMLPSGSGLSGRRGGAWGQSWPGGAGGWPGGGWSSNDSFSGGGGGFGGGGASGRW